MTEEQINIAIAEACGWQWNVQKADGRWWVMYPNGGGAGMTEKITAEYFFSVFSIPNYLNDLNAMHEAVQQFRYANTGSTLWHKNNFFLSEIVSRDLGMSKDCVSFLWELQNATAAQRAEAFLRTIGKWKEAP